MRGRAKLGEDLWRDELVGAEFGPSVHDAMAYGHWLDLNVIPEFGGETGKSIALRFVDTFARKYRVSIGRTNVYRAIALPNALGASRQQRLLVVRPAVIDAELERRRATVKHEN